MLNTINNSYFNQLFKWDGGKVLLLDSFTMPIISMNYSQSQLLNEDIILIDLIDNYQSLDLMKNLNCIIYIKPTAQSIDLLCKEIATPHFHSYKVFFNNIVNKNQLEKIAEHDKFEVIHTIMEIFQDYLVVNDSLYQINNSIDLIDESKKIISLLLSMKKFPIIKFNNLSINCKKISSEILYQINSNLNNNLFEVFNDVGDRTPQLIIFDRLNDALTPLLTPWTYQSMIHELIGIEKSVIKVENDQFLINDEFFNQSKYLNYGDLNDLLIEKINILKKESPSLNTNNLVELKKLITKLPEFKKNSNNLFKHISIISELDNQIKRQHLWELGELQQIIACDLESKASIDDKLMNVIQMPEISMNHKIKLLLLYSVKHPDISKFLNHLDASLVQLKLLNNFHKQFKFKKAESQPPNFKNFLKKFGNNENENVYLQYTPPLKEFLDHLVNAAPINNPLNSLTTLVPESLVDSGAVQDVVIYFKGGVTYEEARVVEEFNKGHETVRVVIGGDRMVSSDQWLEELYNTV
ncbi:vacuolar protein sorting-associated protein 45 [[Candida] jaroonii]|uniref:Vacuolar protein sorting-associated protein 45 n=1 Tax=[Candida] jaroonii TaxID=467808 RepID=A0ACA9YFQ2_9ASCO|nr:vacuolar protein sorting-associated protein 45 [[Candida] jaroonii]